MCYWIYLIIALICLVSSIIYMMYRKLIKNHMNKADFITLIIIMIISGFFTIILSIDIPSALNGGERMYVSELPERRNFGAYISYVITDNEELKLLKNGDWNKYEKYGDYCIRYTKFTKIVLNIEKLN